MKKLGPTIVDALVYSGLAMSRNEAKRLVKQGAVRVYRNEEELKMAIEKEHEIDKSKKC